MGKAVNHKYYLHHYREYSRKQVFDKTGGRCIYCNTQFLNEYDPRFSIEHFIPISKGGLDQLQNVFPCCKECNRYRGNKELNDWRDRLIEKKHSYKGLYHITNKLDLMIINVEKLMKA